MVLDSPELKAASVGERPLSLDTTKDKWYQRGAAGSSDCPRAGSILLEDWKGGVVIVNTTCNSWRCLGCRDRNLRRFKAIVSSGISTLDRSSFITITYKAGTARLLDAGCVAKDWRALWRLLKKTAPDLARLPKLRVMELTKKGTPHFHLILGDVPSDRRIRCYGSSFDVRRFTDRLPLCACVSHEIARAWRRVQDGESWIVHAIPVGGAKGAAAYLAKYMQKTLDAPRMAELGMKRRFSISRNWPSDRRVRLAVSVSAKGWHRTQWEGREVVLDEPMRAALSEEAQERRGTSQQMKELNLDAVRRYVKMAERMFYNGN